MAGPLATHDELFLSTPAIFMAAMAYRTNLLRMLCPISHYSLWNSLHNAENRIKNG